MLVAAGIIEAILAVFLAYLIISTIVRVFFARKKNPPSGRP
jgi:hypothetical protein